MADVILIEHNASGVKREDDTSYPVRMEATLRMPDFMPMAFLGIVGDGVERVVARAKTMKDMEVWLVEQGIKGHSRLIDIKISNSSAK